MTTDRISNDGQGQGQAGEYDFRPRVLYVDDNEEYLLFFSLKYREYVNVVPVFNGSEAFERLSKEHFDIVLAESDIPGFDGLDFIKKLKSSYPLLPVIFYTEQKNEETVREAFLLGITDYFIKEKREPGHMEALVRTIRKLTTNILNNNESIKPPVIIEKPLPVFEPDKENMNRVKPPESDQEKPQKESAPRPFVRSVLDALQANIAVLNEKGRIIDVNSAWKKFARLCGASGNFIGKSYMDFLNEVTNENGFKGKDEINSGIQQVLSGEKQDFTHEYCCKSFRDKQWYVMRVTRFKSSEGIHAVVAHENITSFKMIEEELSGKNRELEDFAYMVSHDLKSPIRIIRGYLALIHEDPSLFEKSYHKIMKQSGFLIKLVDSLLQLSRAGKVIGKKEIIYVNDLVVKIFSILKPDDLNAELHISSPMHTIKGDPARIEQVFRNLIDNSFKHRDTDKEKLILEVSSVKQDGKILITFRDNGTGIQQERIHKIFAPGYTMKQDKGTGFGLSIAQKIIEAHSGKIWVESEGLGKGTTFYIELPDR